MIPSHITTSVQMGDNTAPDVDTTNHLPFYCQSFETDGGSGIEPAIKDTPAALQTRINRQQTASIRIYAGWGGALPVPQHSWRR